MATTTISLPDDQLARLRLVALSSRRSLDEVMREAVDAYLASLPESPSPRVIEPPPGPPSPEWQAEVEAALARIRARVPADMTPEEIEHEITIASEEARQEEVAKRTNSASAHVIEPRSRTPDPARSNAIDAALARLRSKVPPDLTPEEIDAEIDAAWAEVRQARRQRRAARD